MSVLLRLPAGRGRDFVVGDVHGQFHLLESALDRARFEPARDRLISVGDLVDRGRHSAAAADWLARPWFYSVMGNHESMALRAPTDRQMRAIWMLNGGEWWADTEPAVRQQLLAAFERLPWIIELTTGSGRVGVVHAEVPTGLDWDSFVAGIEAGDRELREQILWSRARYFRHDATPVGGIDAIYCGHTVVEEPTTLGNHHYIDTGAYETGRLTVVQVN